MEMLPTGRKILRGTWRSTAHHLRPTDVKDVVAGEGKFHPKTVPFVGEVIEILGD